MAHDHRGPFSLIDQQFIPPDTAIKPFGGSATGFLTPGKMAAALDGVQHRTTLNSVKFCPVLRRKDSTSFSNSSGVRLTLSFIVLVVLPAPALSISSCWLQFLQENVISMIGVKPSPDTTGSNAPRRQDMTAPCVWSIGNAAWGHAAYITFVFFVNFVVNLRAGIRPVSLHPESRSLPRQPLSVDFRNDD